MEIGAKGTTQSVKYSLHIHEDLTLDPQIFTSESRQDGSHL